MRSQNDKATWSILRFDHRTFTAQLASMQRNKQVAAIPEKYIYIDDCCYKGNGKIKEIILPSGCRIIGKEAFASCQLRKPVVFPQTVKEIKESAFSENHSLREVTFPASLEILGDYSYKGCTALKKVAFETSSECRRIPECCFHSCTQLSKVVFPEHLILSRLVDTFFSRISPTMQLPPKHHSIAYVLPWAEGLHWQSRSSGCSNS